MSCDDNSRAARSSSSAARPPWRATWLVAPTRRGGWCRRTSTRERLTAVVRAVAAGFTVLPPALTTSVLIGNGTSRRDPASPIPAESLTPREREVLQRLAEGLPNRAIADALGISDHTVKFHLASIFGKLGAGTRTEAVRLGLRQGLVTI